MALLRITFAAAVLGALMMAGASAQEDDAVPAERASKPPVAITFTPPDLDGDILLGIFDSENRLVRTMRFEPGAPELTVDTNGYIATWDGRDARGVACAAGRYSARGYVVGDEVEVTGEDFHFNDWMAEDKLAATRVELRRWADGFGVEILTPDKMLFARIRTDGTLVPTDEAPAAEPPASPPPGVTPAPLAWARGRDGSTWLIVDDDGQHVVTQLAQDGSTERTLRVARDEPQPVAIEASPREDAILLRETGAGGVERVRLLRRGEGRAAGEADGKVVADWEVAFERTRQPCADFGLKDGKLVAAGGEAGPAAKIPLTLVANALHPEKSKLVVEAAARWPGSALVSPDGLPLLEIAVGGEWKRFAAVPDASTGKVTLYQGDGVIVEQFTIDHLDQMAAFDAGSFLLAPAQ